MKRRMEQAAAFSYKAGNSIIHRCPAWIKILLIPALSVAIFKLPPVFSAILVIFQLILALFLHFSIAEQLKDFRAVLYYAFFLIFARLISVVASYVQAGGRLRLSDFLLDKESLIMLLKLFCLMQTASILFRSSTTLQLREGLEKMEITLRRPFTSQASSKANPQTRPSAPVAQTLALFLCFIPQVSKIWQQTVRAWKARGGRTNLRMYITLLPVLFSVGMKQAYNAARAITIRNAR
ncbi:MAG: energy-coupling factor transporter transmembrane protein EcfT [Treponema sp.]|nr:energy-coupling factor transporter transmembrane protein EcfT [Treponema sp.]